MSNCIFKSVRLALSSSRSCNSTLWLSTPSSLSRKQFSTSHRRLTDLPKKVVYLGNIAYKTDVAQLKELAEGYGPLARITIPSDENNRPAGFANIEFVDAESAKRLYEIAQKDAIVLNGRSTVAHLVEAHQQTRMEDAPTKNLHINRFPREPTVTDIEPFFLRWRKNLVRITIGRVTGRTDSFANVQFTTQDAATEALKEHRFVPFTLDGRKLNVRYGSPRRSHQETQAPSRVLYFRGYIGEDELRDLLRPFGPKVEEIRTLARSENAVSSAGHISCVDIPSATSILEACGDRLLLEYSRPRSQQLRRSPSWSNPKNRTKRSEARSRDELEGKE
ncbi:hypothetical protein PM082_019036 [Marasmius tenuissimus]|nr:hypothetical protein PM082_019036 [Marasmius tenuissimus]